MRVFVIECFRIGGLFKAIMAMPVRGDAFGMEHLPHTPVALVDQGGQFHGWTPAFAAACAHSYEDLKASRIFDIWPELDPGRWSDLWTALRGGASYLVVQVAPQAAASTGGETIELEFGRFVSEGVPLLKVEVRRATAWRLHLMQQELLQAMAYGTPLKSSMETLCRRVEALAPSVVCSILSIDRLNRLRHLASPSLPAHYSAAVDGLPIGPKAGSCGTAAFRGEPVEVTDIATDPLWDDYRHLALDLGLRACWSSPIKAPNGRVVGAFAFYYPRPRGPTLLERQIVDACLHVCMIALENEETRERAYEQAFIDPLTRLPNRARFQQRVSETLAIMAETGQRVVIQHVGIERFQELNELLGYAAGDALLKQVANRLNSVVKDHDAVARISGDEFAIIQVGALGDEDIARRARDIIDLIADPFDVNGHAVRLDASVGIAIGPDDAAGSDALAENAALAMRRAKELGRGTYVFYEKELNERMQRRRCAEADLRAAVAKEDFELHFQPIFDLGSGAVIAAEALLRWHHPERGPVSPSEFIPLAEKCGLIEKVGAFAIRNACLAAAQWPENISVAVNLSPLQFDSPGLVSTVTSALEESGLSPSRLELEITESVLLRDSAVNSALLDELSDRGVSIALDDFGAGYSSLRYLNRFSFDRIKIDHSFIRDIIRNEGSLKIVRAIVMLAHSLGLKVTAEGVETDEQLAMVRSEGCDAVQGFLTGAPEPLASFVSRVRRSKGTRVTAA